MAAFIRTINIDIKKINARTRYRGIHQGESGATEITVDLSSWFALWPEAFVSAVFKRPDGNAYSIEVEENAGSIKYGLDEVDTEIPGNAEMEIELTDDEEIVKTAIIPLYIERDIGMYVPKPSINTGDIPYSGPMGTEYLPVGGAGQLLSSNGEVPEWKSLTAADVPIEDAGGLYDSENAEDALQEVSEGVGAISQSFADAGVAFDENGSRFRGPVNIDTDDFSLRNGDEEIMTLYPDGLAINAGSVHANIVTGGNVVTYNEQEEFTVSGSIQTTIDNIKKFLTGDVTVYVPNNKYNENIQIIGFSPYTITLVLADWVTISGSITVVGSNVTIKVANLADKAWIKAPAPEESVGAILAFKSRLRLEGIKISGYVDRSSATAGSEYGIYASESLLTVRKCTVEKIGNTGDGNSYAIMAIDNSAGYVTDVIGGKDGGNYASVANLKYGICAFNGSIVHIGGTGILSAAGDLASLGTITGSNTPTQSDGSFVPPATPENYTAHATNRAHLIVRHDLLHGAQPFDTSYAPRQGYWNANCCFGLWLMPAITNYANVSEGTVTITRDGVTGINGPVTVYLYYHNLTIIPGGTYSPATARALFTYAGVSASIAKGGSATLKLPIAAINAIKAGTLKGFGVIDKGYPEMDEGNYTMLTNDITFKYTVTP